MQLEKNKATRIMKEIVSYFLDHDLNDFKMEFTIDGGVFRLYVEAATAEEPASFQTLVADLNTERQLEVDEYYNALLGSHAHAHEHDYTFLGKAIDKAEGKFEDGKLSLLIWRFEEH